MSSELTTLLAAYEAAVASGHLFKGHGMRQMVSSEPRSFTALTCPESCSIWRTAYMVADSSGVYFTFSFLVLLRSSETLNLVF
jgi:hypothetical protein